jgi:cytochrome c5
MSQAQDDHDLPHEGPIKTPKQLIWAVGLAFVVPIVAIILLANYVTAQKSPGAGSDGFGPEAVAQRLQRVGQVEVRDLSDPAAQRTGAQVYAAQCTACHSVGAAGAPKTGDAAAWAPRIKQGYDVLLTSALKGKGAMAPQGGGDFSDFEIARAVVYLANQGGAKFEEPKAPAGATAAATAAAPAPAVQAAPAAVSAAPAPAGASAPLSAATPDAAAPAASSAANQPGGKP